eukprot:TRINITY_DN12769_c0_g1_i1.p1 TRINITY_DN12769_c0_g1~~TRINITY_DN12769_c0_g1_i1.p1  ORF type:complete len:158 (+),score=39.55 TRINITY_DN12769_c0_g1_i1:91-564(+)
MTVTIRPIERGDEDAWKRLWKLYIEFYESSVPDEVTLSTFNRFFEESEPVHSAVAFDEEAGKVVGFVNWIVHRTTWSINNNIYLQDLFVDPEVRNGGVGRMLIEHVYGKGDEMQAAKVYWHTQHFNHRAQLLYTKVGKLTDFVMYARPPTAAPIRKV